MFINLNSSYENGDNIDLKALSQYEGTRLGQELYAEILDEAAGALWNRKMIDDAQFDLPEDCIVKDEDGITVNFDASRKEFAKSLIKVVVSVDPAITQTKNQTLQVLWLPVLILTVTHTSLRMPQIDTCLNNGPLKLSVFIMNMKLTLL